MIFHWKKRKNIIQSLFQFSMLTLWFSYFFFTVLQNFNCQLLQITDYKLINDCCCGDELPWWCLFIICSKFDSCLNLCVIYKRNGSNRSLGTKLKLYWFGEALRESRESLCFYAYWIFFPPFDKKILQMSLLRKNCTIIVYRKMHIGNLKLNSFMQGPTFLSFCFPLEAVISIFL